MNYWKVLGRSKLNIYEKIIKRMKELKALYIINIIKMTHGFLFAEMDSQPVCLSLANPGLDYPFTIVVFLSLIRVQLFATPPWTAARQASLSFTVSRSMLKLVSIGSTMIYSW